MIEPSDRGLRRGVFLAGLSLALASGLFSCSRDDAEDGRSAIARANRAALTHAGWGVRQASDVEWLCNLARGDTYAWEILIDQPGVLDVELEFGIDARTTVEVPVDRGHSVYVVFRPRLGESGLVDHRKIKARTTVPVGESSWGVSSERWGASIAVLAPCGDQRIVVTSTGRDRVDWDAMDGQYVQIPRPHFSAPLAMTHLEGTPFGPLGIPADARITGIAVGVLPVGSMLPIRRGTLGGAEESLPATGMSVPASPTADKLLLEVTWSTRSRADAPPIDVGTWVVRARLRHPGGSSTPIAGHEPASPR